MVTFVPLWVQSVLGATPTQAGASIAFMAVGWPMASALSGRLLPALGYRRLVRGGLGLVALAAIGLALLLRPGVRLLDVQLLTFAYGLGLGFANTPLVIAVQTSVPWNRRGVATSSTMFFRTIGGTLAVGILGGVLARALGASGASPEVTEKLLGPERALLPPALVAGLSSALQDAMVTVFWAVAAIAAAAFAVSLLFPRLELAPAPDGPGTLGPDGPAPT
jgi:MFS family permease